MKYWFGLQRSCSFSLVLSYGHFPIGAHCERNFQVDLKRKAPGNAEWSWPRCVEIFATLKELSCGRTYLVTYHVASLKTKTSLWRKPKAINNQPENNFKQSTCSSKRWGSCPRKYFTCLHIKLEYACREVQTLFMMFVFTKKLLSWLEGALIPNADRCATILIKSLFFFQEKCNISF